MSNKLDAVFEGGGVRGIGLVGAAAVVEERGYIFENVAGTSAGAIVASLLAAGFEAEEIYAFMDGDVDLARIKDRSLLDRIPAIGPLLSLIRENGIYEGDYLEEVLRAKLASKGIRTFEDLVIDEYRDAPRYRYRLQVVAVDVTREKLLLLPRDIADYGIEPDDLDVAKAVRMSMSIPLFFEPVTLTHESGKLCHIVDGGVLSNFPVWIFDDDTANPPWPTFGFRLIDGDNAIDGPYSFAKAVGLTMINGFDPRFSEPEDDRRSMLIPAGSVGLTRFDLTPAERRQLYESGRKTAERFVGRWNFAQYKNDFRRNRPPPRGARLLI